MKPKVLHIFSGYGGGISSLILNLVESSYENIDHTLLAFSYDQGESFIRRMEATNTQVLLMNSPRKVGFNKFIQSIKRAFRSTKFDAVHCHIDGKSLIIFRTIAKLYGVNTFVVHAHKALYENKLDRSSLIHHYHKLSNYLFSTHYMTCSDLAANYIFGSRFLKKRKAYLIPNGIDDSRFGETISSNEIMNYNNEFNVCNEELILCHVGRMTPPKNHNFILELAAMLKKKGFRYKLLLIGSGELEDSVNKNINDLQLTSQICVTGRRLDISKIMQYADLLILPSLSEGLPTVAIECQASGTHMFLSDVITRQCDMGLGLLKFLPLDIEVWGEQILKFQKSNLQLEVCHKRIKELHFSAKDAGTLYVEYINNFIKDNKNI